MKTLKQEIREIVRQGIADVMQYSSSSDKYLNQTTLAILKAIKDRIPKKKYKIVEPFEVEAEIWGYNQCIIDITEKIGAKEVKSHFPKVIEDKLLKEYSEPGKDMGD